MTRRFTVSSSLALVGIAIGVAGGCSSAKSDAPPTDAGSPVDDGGATPDAAPDVADASAPDGAAAAAACARYASAHCALLAKCSDDELVLRFGKKESCEPRLALDCTTRLALRDVTISVASVDACAAALPSAACAGALYDALPAACEVPRGTRSTGEPCVDRAQCAGGSCDRSKGGACGTCAELPALGAKCRPPFMQSGCGSEQTCEGDTCGKLVGLGAACDATKHCGADLSCTGGKCVKAAAEGDTCDLADPSAPSCGWGSVCNPVCHAINVMAYDTPDCTSVPRSVCGGHATCDGSCIAPPLEGSACKASASSEDEKCQWPAVCEGGRCVLATGTTCK